MNTADLQQVLQPSFPERPIVRIDCRASDYRSSFPLDELALRFADERIAVGRVFRPVRGVNGPGDPSCDGTPLKLIFKNCDPRALAANARRAKPEFLDDPLREIEVYRHVLSADELGTAICYGTVADPVAERYWLFLEQVAGRELYQCGEFEIWRHAARWLAEFHGRFASADSVPLVVRERLIRHDAAYFEIWLQRARSFHDHPFLQQLANEYPRLVRELTALPPTLIHGEFYASNVLVRDVTSQICPVDWERAAWGPGQMDVAALTAGKWSESAKTELALAYHAALRDAVRRDDFLRGWRLCRLHLAVQWLGWSPDWSPPAEHRQDWLAEAIAAASQLKSEV